MTILYFDETIYKVLQKLPQTYDPYDLPINVSRIYKLIQGLPNINKPLDLPDDFLDLPVSRWTPSIYFSIQILDILNLSKKPGNPKDRDPITLFWPESKKPGNTNYRGPLNLFWREHQCFPDFIEVNAIEKVIFQEVFSYVCYSNDHDLARYSDDDLRRDLVAQAQIEGNQSNAETKDQRLWRLLLEDLSL